jgi:cell division protein FtsX
MGEETKELIKALKHEVEELKGEKEVEAKLTALQLILNWIDKIKWWALIVLILVVLWTAGFTPDQIVRWAKDIMGALPDLIK